MIDHLFYDARYRGGDDGIYPEQVMGPHGRFVHMPLQLVISSTGTHVNFLDITSIFDPTTRSLHFKLYDKRRDMMIFKGVITFPDHERMVSDNCKYKVIRSQLFRFDHNCTYARDFIMHTANLICSMSRNSYNVPRLLHELHISERRNVPVGRISDSDVSKFVYVGRTYDRENRRGSKVGIKKEHKQAR